MKANCFCEVFQLLSYIQPSLI